MTEKYDMSQIDEIIKQGLREQSMSKDGSNSSTTHGSLYPVQTPIDGETDLAEMSDQNKTEDLVEPQEEPISGSSRPLRMVTRRSWG